MMDKTNDNLNANGQQKLSMEDLEKVSGGGVCFNVHDIKTEDDLRFYVYDFIGTIEKKSSKGVALEMVLSQFPSNDVKIEYGKGNLDSLYNLLGQKFLDRQGAH